MVISANLISKPCLQFYTGKPTLFMNLPHQSNRFESAENTKVCIVHFQISIDAQ